MFGSGSIGGAFSTPVDKMWRIFNAFGLFFFRCVLLVMAVRPHNI